MRVIPYLFYLLLIASHHVIWQEYTSIYGIVINLAALAVVLVALYRDAVPAAWFGFFCGIVSAAGLPGVLGWYGLAMALLAVGVCYARVQLNLDTIRPRLLLAAGAVLVYNLVSVGAGYMDGFPPISWSSAILGAVYTTLVAWPFFLIKERIVTVKKIREIF